jgi:hypothetical protein
MNPGWIKNRIRIRMRNPDPDPESGINIPDHISESLATIFLVKILEFFDADPDPRSGNLLDLGSGIEKIRIRDEHPRSATLIRTLLCMVRYNVNPF